jgi:hypothetical protein
MPSTSYTAKNVSLGKEEEEEKEEEILVKMSASGSTFYITPNDKILQKQEIIFNIADFEPEGGEEAEISSKTSAIFYIFIMVEYQEDSNMLKTQI